MSTNGSVAIAVMITPTSAVMPPPTRSVTRPESAIANAAPMPCGMSSRPVWTASWPRTVWKYSGIRIIAPNSAAPRQNVVNAAAANALLANRRMSSSGSGMRSERTTNVRDERDAADERDEHGGDAIVPVVPLSARP